MARVPIGSTDFSPRTYTYNEKVDDFAMTNFTIASDKAPLSNKINLIQRALSMAKLRLFASSWAPPLWMTRGQSVVDCKIKGSPGEKYWAALALYYSKFFDAYKGEGIEFWAMTVQNEPEEPTIHIPNWETLRMTPEEERDFIKLNLGPLMARNHPVLKILANDDQKSGLLDRSAPFDDPESKKYISGVAFHWYKNLDFILPGAGNYRNLKKFNEAYPDVFMLGSEACEGYMPRFIGTGRGPSMDDPERTWKRAQNYARDIIENSNNMAAGWVDWNLFLDSKGGPNWAENMVDAPILVAEHNGTEFYKQPMYYIMGHFSKFVPPGSRRIELPKSETLSDFHRCAFVTPSNQIVMQFLNRKESEVTISVKEPNLHTFTLKLPAKSMQTIILPASADTTILPASKDSTPRAKISRNVIRAHFRLGIFCCCISRVSSPTHHVNAQHYFGIGRRAYCKADCLGDGIGELSCDQLIECPSTPYWVPTSPPLIQMEAVSPRRLATRPFGHGKRPVDFTATLRLSRDPKSRRTRSINVQ
uniref:Glycosyl hydrolase family 30 TIM-barrel domain-containing protein n=1 Tax=Hyaloperonospora arabidopsidis (strain Emoy2) TaxID=559515 RepID=M4BQ46_HYAAE